MSFGRRPFVVRPCVRLLLALGFATLSTSRTWAAPVPAASYSITLNNTAPITTPGQFVMGNEIGEIQTLPAPLAFAHVTDQGRSLVEMEYWFRVNGPSANLPVTIQVTGRTEIDAAGASFATQGMIWGVAAQLTAQSFDGQLGPGVGQIDSKSDGVSCNPNSVGPIPVPLPIPTCPAIKQTKTIVLKLNVLTGADNRVLLFAVANNQEAFFADFDVLVDPVISFEPGFDSTGYSIELSPGVSNGVPEPSAAVLLAMVGLVGAALRRRARK
jgi:hypothetical protein